MASSKSPSVHRHIKKPKKRNPGIHSKNKSARNKKSKTYKKRYRRQGRNK